MELPLGARHDEPAAVIKGFQMMGVDTSPWGEYVSSTLTVQPARFESQ